MTDTTQRLPDSNIPIDLKKFTINDFEVGAKLGNGRFGDVYLAREKQSSYIVALKILNKKEIKRLNAEKLVVREIKIHSFLDHPNVIKLFGVFHDKHKIYLILEYAPDSELYSEIKNQPLKKFKESMARNYLKQVISSFVYLQSLGILHRDLKPENLLNFMVHLNL